MDSSITCIFSINTGRSGSHYLQKIFSHVLNCESYHEPEPEGSGEAMREYAQGYSEPMRMIAQQKVDIIRNTQLNGNIYVETNHCFIKGFGWFIPKLLDEYNVGVVILKREESQIASSQLRIGCSPLLEKGRKWTTTPDKKNPLVKPPSLLVSARMIYQAARLAKWICLRIRAKFKGFQDPQWLINYELECLKWYVRETNAQAEAFKKQFPNVRYYEIDIKDLNSYETVQDMLRHFGCREKESLTEVVGKPTNRKRRINK